MINRTSVLLPLDKGSILLPTTHNPYETPQLTTIHTDGHILQARHNAERGFYHAERKSNEIGWLETDYSQSWIRTVADLADKQAFGFRVNGKTVNPLSHQFKEETRTVELELLNYGGIAISSPKHVPIGVYLKTGESYRIDTEEPKNKAILSYRPDNRSEWEVVETTDLIEITYLASGLAEKTEMECLYNPTPDGMAEEINNKFKSSHKRAQSREEEKITELAAINVETTFNETIPQPAPLKQEK
jgi:hypothetical protein